MSLGHSSAAEFGPFLVFSAGLLVLIGCGGSGGSNPGGGSTPVDNTQALQVNLGPANNSTNEAFVAVTVCVPGSSSCQTIENVEVDTGSEGLRVLSSQISLSLPAIADTSRNALEECVSFADTSYVWGPVVSADVQMAGEKATSVPIQIISASPKFPVPSNCISGAGAADVNTVAALGANGILGLGVFQQDCGFACTSASPQVPDVYYLCPNSVCRVSTVPLGSQLQNPVWFFPQDNNGVVISLPSVPADGVASVSGSLIFGIGTQSDNALGSAQVYTTDNAGNFQTTYHGIAYSQSYIDSGSNGLYILDASTLGITDCSDFAGFYCPASPVDFTATNTGLNGVKADVSFSIANADALFAANGGRNAAFDDLGGDNPQTVDWGLPFFYGRKVFVGIEGQLSPTGVTGPYWAY